MADTGRVCGADGCPAGWLAVTMPPGNPGRAAARIVARAEDLPALGTPVAIDIPIGLMDRAGAPRAADVAARASLSELNADGHRGVGSRVFAAPSRAHLDLFRHGLDCAGINRPFPPGQRLSRQCCTILPKIAELDELLRRDAGLPVFEAHPEVTFAHLDGLTLPPKKQAAGRAARVEVLARKGFDTGRLAAALGARSRRWAMDDLLDACALALTADRIAAGRHRTLPDPPETDAHGLRRAIHC